MIGKGVTMNTHYIGAALIAAGVALSGCASIVRGTSQTIAIATPPTAGAMCMLSSGQGNWTVMSPGAVSVEKSKEDIQVHCTKAGFQDGIGIIPSNFEGWTAGNLVFGGIIGVGVDAATGAINEYPHSYQVPMLPLSYSQQAVPAPGGAPPSALVDSASPESFAARNTYMSLSQYQAGSAKKQKGN